MKNADDRAILVASRQRGLVTWDQAKGAGLSSKQIWRRVRAGRLVLVHPRVYRLPGPAPTWPTMVLAACLAAGPTAVASHRSAAALWGLRGFEPGPRVPVEITVQTRTRSDLGETIVHLSNLVHRLDVTTLGRIPVTVVTRTLYDLAAVVPMETLESAVEDAVLRRLTTAPRLEGIAARLDGRGRVGTNAFRHLLADHDPATAPTESVLEDELVRILRQRGVPAPSRQVWLDGPHGERVRLDLAYPDARLAVEAQSRTWHSITADRDRDAAKLNVVAALHWRILWFTTSQIRYDPAYVAATVANALRG